MDLRIFDMQTDIDDKDGRVEDKSEHILRNNEDVEMSN